MVRREGASGHEKETEERLLIEEAQKDPSRFAELYEIHFNRVYAYIARRVRGRSEVEDLTSEVFHQALRNLARFEWRGVPFAAWLYRIAGNAVVDRSQRVGREVPISADTDEIGIEDRNLAEIDERARLADCVDALPADQRRVVAMRFMEEKRIREVAGQLGRSEGAVKQLQFRALENLRECMGRSDG